MMRWLMDSASVAFLQENDTERMEHVHFMLDAGGDADCMSRELATQLYQQVS
ncbi:hypothetical protein [Alicyclobacillus ferrooxydans]|uniref:hypothetical protein n=1 Tax=Alicyclobacillus ferrooxydans TaxID=471514 RepID=UPI001B80DE52|nr:hypothetical protein [Alicyclobacillus ferrooxydans]